MKKHTFNKLVGIGLASALAFSSLTMMASAAATDFSGDIAVAGQVKTITLNMDIPAVSATLDVYNVDGNGQVYLQDDTDTAIDAALITSYTQGVDVNVSITNYNVAYTGTDNNIVLATTDKFAEPTSTRPATKGLYLALETTTAATNVEDDFSISSTATQTAVRTAMTGENVKKSVFAKAENAANIALGKLTKSADGSTAVDAVGFDITGAANPYVTTWAATDGFTITLTYAIQPALNA